MIDKYLVPADEDSPWGIDGGVLDVQQIEIDDHPGGILLSEDPFDQFELVEEVELEPTAAEREAAAAAAAATAARRVVEHRRRRPRRRNNRNRRGWR